MTRFIPHLDRFLNNVSACAAALLLLLPCASEAGETSEGVPNHPLTLHECISIALGESPALEGSRFDLLSAVQEVRAAQGLVLPQITGSAQYQIFSGSPTSKFSVINLGSITPNGTVVTSNTSGLSEIELYGAHLRYPLFNDGSILGLNNAPAIAEKKARRQALAWTVNLTREEVIYRVSDEFVTTVSARNRMGLAERRVKLLDQSVGITQEQQKQGLKLPLDVRVAREQFSAAQTLLKLLREQATAGSLALSKTLGLSSSSRLSLSDTLPDAPDPPPTTEQLIGACLNHHPSLQKQRAVIDQAKQDYRLERFRLYPSVYLDGSANYIDDFTGVSNSGSVFVGGIAVNVPIFDFGAQLATTRSKLMKYKAEQARLLSTADDVNYEVLKTYQVIYTLTQNILDLQGDVAKAQRDVQVLEAQQQQGIAEPLNVIEKELHLIAKQDELQGIEARRLSDYARLQRAAGGAWKWIP
ncbi:MAG TPA: TolC family protein [Candidatus Udaeobacter sp.]|jgi:outer membrane protein TolC|nr:TolC family protein [Candidatus Udaeobacter sp.]